MTYSESEVAQSCLALCDPMDGSLPGSSVRGIFQARVLEWVAVSFSRGSSQPRDQTRVSCIPGRHFNLWATKEALIKHTIHKNIKVFSILCIVFLIKHIISTYFIGNKIKYIHKMEEIHIFRKIEIWYLFWKSSLISILHSSIKQKKYFQWYYNIKIE